MEKRRFLLLSAFLTLLIGLVACQPQIVEVEVTRVVVEEVEVEGETVEVTRVVTETEEVEVEVEVTRVVEVEAVDPAMAARAANVIFDIDGGSVVDPELWNPYAAGRRLDHGLIQALAEPLFMLNLESPDGEMIPWLGESMEANDDSTVWTIALREGITWSDGETLDADDFLFTVNMALDTPDLTGTPDFSGVESVEKVDDLTLQFTLSATNTKFGPSSFAVQTGSSFIILPEHIWAGEDPLTFTNYDPAQGWPVFSGAYTLESASETEFVYARNDDWWGVAAGFDDLPAPEKVTWVAYGTAETRSAAMARGELDSLMDISLGSYLALQQLTGTTTAWKADFPYAWVGACARNLHFNHTQAPWDDPDMRRAINYAVNRDQIIEIAYEGTSVASPHWLPSYGAFNTFVDSAVDAGLYDGKSILENDVEQAKAIIESKGWALNDDGFYAQGGEQFDMTITSFDDGEMNDIASLIVEQLQAIGINAVHDIQPIPEFIGNLTNAGFDSYVFFICGPVDLWAKMDAFSTRHIPEEGGESSGFYANTQRWNSDAAQAYSDVVAQMRDLDPNSPEMEALFLEAMALWIDDAPALPLAQATKLVPFDETYWTNWPTADNPYIQPATWWQSTHLIIHNLESAQ